MEYFKNFNKKYLFTIILVFNYLLSHNKFAIADILNQNILNEPIHFNQSILNNNSVILPICIKAKNVTLYYPKDAFFWGNVKVQYDNIILTADKLHFNQQIDSDNITRTISAYGDINYFNHKIEIQGSTARYNLNTKDLNIYNGKYKLIGLQIHGNADVIKQRHDNRYTLLKNGDFTSCLPNDNIWNILGTELIYDHKNQTTKIKNARFKIGAFTIFYIPYLKFSMSNNNYYGFQIPNIKYGKNGFEFNTSYHFYLANNTDYIFRLKYLSKLGVQFQTEINYFIKPGEGLLEFDYLADKRFYFNNYNNNWLFFWRHNGSIDDFWHFNSNYTKIGNSNYFYNINSKYININHDYIKQNFFLNYTDQDWDVRLAYKKFKLFNTNIKNFFYATPQMDVFYYKNKLGPFNFKLINQAVIFTHFNNQYPRTVRLYIEPIFQLPLVNNLGYLNTEIKLMLAYYRQNNINFYNKNTALKHHLKHSLLRIIPEFKIDGKVTFKQNIPLLKGYIQFLEPRLQYIYIPYRNKNGIGNYDSMILQTNYISLFRDRIYSGPDYILPINQITGGVFTSIYDNSLIERANLYISQIYYFSQYNYKNNINWHNNIINSITLAGDGNLFVNNKFKINGNIQFNTKINTMQSGNVTMEYKQNKNCILQLSYRHVNPDYIKYILSKITYSKNKQGISQIGIISTLPILNSWSVTNSFYYDINLNKLINKSIILQYSTCCLVTNIGYEQKIIGWNNYINSSKYDNKIMFNITLQGIGKNSILNIDNLLNSNMIPYQQIF